MTLYFEIAAGISFISCIIIFIMMYLNDINNNHERDIENERKWHQEERIQMRIDKLESKLDELSNNVADSMDSRPRRSTRSSN
jgi:hypothetical protein